MYTTDLIRKFPEDPKSPILFVVYNENMVWQAEELIEMIHSPNYLEEHVTVVPLNTKVENHTKYDVYIDPGVYKFMHSWSN